MNIGTRLSAVGYFADFVTVPAGIAAAFFLAVRYGEPDDLWPLLILAGYASWSLFEYALHRFILHGLYRRDHWLHHMRPSEYIGVSAAFTFGAFAAFWLFCSSISFAHGQVFFAGFYAGYFTYRLVHHALHQWSDDRLQRTFKTLHDAHEIHHLGAPVNFGVQTLIWDRLFGTYQGIERP